MIIGEGDIYLFDIEASALAMGGTAKQIAIAAMAIALQLLQIADPLGPLQCNMPLIALAEGA